MISIPSPLELHDTEYQNVKFIHEELDYMNKTNHFIEQMKKTSS